MIKSSGRSVAVVLTVLASLVFLLTTSSAFAATTVVGAGATFPLPLYQQWASDYSQKNPGVQIVYTGGGSGFGQSQIKAGAVDFGGTDQPLTKADLQDSGLVQFPTCVGGVVPVVHLNGIGTGKLRLTGRILANIFLGAIRKWNDPAIKAMNKGLSLPAAKIAVVHRSDASGTTWIFTNYLSRVSPVWLSSVGIGTSVSWPRGVGGNGNPGIAAIVASTPDSIGYVEYAYAKANKLAYVRLRNKTGIWVSPSVATFAAAARSAHWSWANGFYTVLVNQQGKTSWPITAATYVLVRRTQSSQAFGRTMLKYFDWCYRDATAGRDATSLDYVSMPTSVAAKVEAVWATYVKAGGKPCWP